MMGKLENHKVAKLFWPFSWKLNEAGQEEDLFLTQKNKRLPNLKWNLFIFQDVWHVYKEHFKI